MTRPVNHMLFSLRYPITAYVSLLHRLSGLFLALLIPGMLWILDMSLTSAQGFNTLKESFNNVWLKWGLFCFLMAFIYHFLAGLRHMIMDSHIADSKRGGRAGSWVVLGLFTLLFLIGLAGMGLAWS